MTISVTVTGGSISTAITGGSIATSVTGASIGVAVAVAQREYQGWLLNDNLAGTAVSGDIAGTLTGGNTADVYSTDNTLGKPSFRLNGSSQYVTIPLTQKMLPAEYADLWTKHASNPVIQEASAVQFGNIVANPSGGWWFFGCYDGDVVRYASTDLITWTDRTEVLSAVPGGWDAALQVCHVFQLPDDSWMMFYRGNGTGGLQIGRATSVDGTTWTRHDNGGVDDGLFPQFGGNYDLTCVILIDGVYYAYVNGSPSHGHTNIYYSADLDTWTAYANNPVFNNGYCGTVFKYSSSYYIVICRDLIESGTTLYDHGLALYRCPDQYFQPADREHLGYVAINDQTYDDRYLDTPTIPMTDVSRSVYPAEFGDTLYCLYTGDLTGATQNLLTSSLSDLATRTAIDETATERWHLEARTFSFWVQFDSFAVGKPVFSIGTSPTDSSPVHLLSMRGGTNPYYLSLYLQGGNRAVINVNLNQMYHIAVVDNVGVPTLCYQDGVKVGTLNYDGTNSDCIYLYLGTGTGGFHDGYLSDFRIYDRALTDAEIEAIYDAG